MIFVISSGFSSIQSLLSRQSTVFVQQFPDGVQAMGHGVIQALTVIVQADTAQDCGINAIVERDRLSGDLAQLSCELLLLRRGVRGLRR